MTVRKSILVAVANLLNGVPNAIVYRSREEALSREEGTGIIVKPEDEPVENRAGGGPGGLTLRNLMIVVTVLTRGAGAPSGYTPDDIADPVMQSAHALLMADTTLGGLCSVLIEHSTKCDFEVADGSALAAELRYIVRYQTHSNDLSTAI